MNILLVIILFLEQNHKSAGKQTKFIFQKDLSEHCRRRVVPSIFLGRQVVEANARVLQFSRLELPYSCFISIRTESGSNMVMMIQLPPHDLRNACAKNSEQLLVYEMGETFGGYWGPLPDSVTNRDPPPPKIYTLKTSHPTTTALSSSDEETDITKLTTEPNKISEQKSTGDFIEMEVPLLNVSVHLVPGKEEIVPVENDDKFGVDSDVTPIPGVKYDRKILPLVQFHLIEEQPGTQENGEDEPPKYELDIVQEFTTDVRLTRPQFNPTSKRRTQKQWYQRTRHLDFNKHRTLFNSQRWRQHGRRLIPETITRRMNDITKYSFPKNIPEDNKLNYTQDSWEIVNDLIKKLDKAKERDIAGKTTLAVYYDAMLLEKISNMNHNLSVYLSPNLAMYNSHDPKYIFTNKDKYSTWKLTSRLEEFTKKQHEKENTITENQTKMMSPRIIVEDITADNETPDNIESVTEKMRSEVSEKTRTELKMLTLDISSSRNLETSSMTLDSNKTDEFLKSTNEPTLGTIPNESETLTASSKKGIDSFKNNKKIVTGSMVGHESWENFVQAAPEMAVFLNQTVPDDATLGNGETKKEFNEMPLINKPLRRKKRGIHSIAIENARPHKMSTKKTFPTTTQASFEVADMQEFAQLVELQDDELHGRIALRYLPQYVGPVLLNLCELDEATTRHVHLFNSSRIALAINNFSLESMVIVLTAARTLLNGEIRCPKSQLECQVAGARVCLDSMVACDGVPNCGSYDIYDEDRLLCGSSVGLQHNVYLAAFTFLAFLLTVLYAVHYWLKRCVPKVADAFFIYKDGVENILYLDSIMRSPNDTNEDNQKMVYHSRLYGDDNDNIYEQHEATQEREETAWQRFLRKFCFCFWKTPINSEISDERSSMAKKVYSFTEFEIRKMTSSSKEIAVQTGDSLEMKHLDNFDNLSCKLGTSTAGPSYDLSMKVKDSLLTLEEPLPEEHKDELSLLKFFNNARRDSLGSFSNRPPRIKGLDPAADSSEKEISILNYDRLSAATSGLSTANKKEMKSVTSSNAVGKHLRFNEKTTTIPSVKYHDEEDDSNIHLDRRRSVALGESRWRGSRPLDTIEEKDEFASGREHRHFWGSITGKKQKKKTVFYYK